MSILIKSFQNIRIIYQVTRKIVFCIIKNTHQTGKFFVSVCKQKVARTIFSLLQGSQTITVIERIFILFALFDEHLSFNFKRQESNLQNLQLQNISISLNFTPY